MTSHKPSIVVQRILMKMHVLKRRSVPILSAFIPVHFSVKHLRFYLAVKMSNLIQIIGLMILFALGCKVNETQA